MNNLNRTITIKALKTIQRICLPLRQIGIHEFNHDITFGHQKISIITNNQKVFSSYYHEGLPTICADDNGRTLKEGQYFSKYLIKSYEDCSIMLPFLSNRFGWHHSFHIVEKENDCQHLFTFTTYLDEVDFVHFIVNHLDKIKMFIKRYQSIAHEIITQAKKPAHQITLPYLKRDTNTPMHHVDFLTKRKMDTQNKSVIDFTRSLPVTFSAQQKRCFLLLLEGKSAKEIAAMMHLSPRTIEHYIELIRFLLNCKNTKEMISQYSHLLSSHM